jgi:hypothetical protein
MGSLTPTVLPGFSLQDLAAIGKNTQRKKAECYFGRNIQEYAYSCHAFIYRIITRIKKIIKRNNYKLAVYFFAFDVYLTHIMMYIKR